MCKASDSSKALFKIGNIIVDMLGTDGEADGIGLMS